MMSVTILMVAFENLRHHLVSSGHESCERAADLPNAKSI